jgi:adenine-specific DNA glycosylase
MLQQTQVSRVEDYYTTFLKKYPTIHALAAARSRSVRESWLGLGYYRRATNLHRLAQEIVRTTDGVIPRSLKNSGRFPAWVDIPLERWPRLRSNARRPQSTPT